MTDNQENLVSKVVYYLVKQLDACFYFRCLVPGKYLERNHGWKCYYDKIDDIFEMKDDGSYNFDRIKDSRREILDKADLIVLQRGTDYGHLQFIRYVKCHLKKPIIFEADDNYFDVDPSNTGYRYFAPRKPEISQMMSEVDGMTVTVPELVTVYSPYNSNIHVIPNLLDFEKIDKAPSLANDSRLLACSIYRCPKNYIEDGLMGAVKKIASDLLKKDNIPQTDENIDKMISGPVQFNIPVTFDAYRRMREEDSNLIIGWGGSPTHVMDIEIVRKPLLKVMEKYRRVNFTMVGFIHMLSLLQNSPYGVNVRRWLIDMDYKRFWHFNYVGVKNYFSLYKSLSFDIGLAPVAPIKFNKAKSNLKAIEYMALGVYPMVSNFDTYQGIMEKEGSANNEIGRGRICKTEDDWENNFYEVLNDHDMRAESIYHNDQYVRKYFDADLESYRWDGIYRKFL